MKIQTFLPARVDIGGGVTDIPQFGSCVGTSVANIAIDLFADEWCQTRIGASIEAKLGEGPNVLYINEYKVERSNPRAEQSFLVAMFNYFSNRLGISEGVSLRISNNLPGSTGLGASASLCLGMLTSLYRLKGSNVALLADKIVNEAHRFETIEQGILGGFQDYIAAFFGGYNYIDFSSLEGVNLASYPSFKQRLPIVMEEYLNQNMLIVIRKNGNISSGEIVGDEIANYSLNKNAIEQHLIRIKAANRTINTIINSPLSDSWLEAVSREINDSWEAQKKLSGLVGAGFMNSLEHKVRPYVSALRGPGAGGNSLLLLSKPPHRAELIQLLQGLNDEVMLAYVRVNHGGLGASETKSLKG